MIDLHHIDKYQENNRIEAKRATGGFPHSLWETYSAFANTIGGLILLGVEEARDKTLTVVGVPDPEEYRRIFWEGVNSRRVVSVNILKPEDVTVQWVEGKAALVIQVPRASRREKPVYLGDSPFTGSYRRDGEGDYHCTEEEVRGMLRDRDDAPQDLRPLEEIPLSCLCQKTLREFRLLMAMRNPDHPWNRLPDEEFLLAAGAAGWDARRWEVHPTVAGLLLFGQLRELKATFPHYRLIYREEEREIDSESGDWSGNLFDFYWRTARRLTALSILHTADQEKAAFIAGALREAAGNAILHADYFGGGGLQILRTRDALWVKNPGAFRVSPERAKTGGDADPRNVVLTRLFALVRVGSGGGQGLRSIYATWAQQGWSAPRLQETFGPDATSLALPLSATATADRLSQRIAEYLTEEVTATAKKLARDLKVSPVKAQAALSRLAAQGLVTAQGSPPVYALRA